MMLSIFSYVCGPSVCPPWRSVCSGPLPVFESDCLPGVQSCEFFIYFGDPTLVWGIIGKYVFPYGWFPQINTYLSCQMQTTSSNNKFYSHQFLGPEDTVLWNKNQKRQSSPARVPTSLLTTWAQCQMEQHIRLLKLSKCGVSWEVFLVEFGPETLSHLKVILVPWNHF